MSSSMKKIDQFLTIAKNGLGFRKEDVSSHLVVLFVQFLFKPYSFTKRFTLGFPFSARFIPKQNLKVYSSLVFILSIVTSNFSSSMSEALYR